MPYTHLHKGDFFVLCIVGILAIGLLLCPHLSHTGSGTYCEIRCGDTVTRYPLTDERTIPLTHNGYTLTVTAEGSGLRVSEADCPTQDCVHTGAIFRSGQSIVCLPARVVIQLIGGAADDGGVDIVIG